MKYGLVPSRSFASSLLLVSVKRSWNKRGGRLEKLDHRAAHSDCGNAAIINGSKILLLLSIFCVGTRLDRSPSGSMLRASLNDGGIRAAEACGATVLWNILIKIKSAKPVFITTETPQPMLLKDVEEKQRGFLLRCWTWRRRGLPLQGPLISVPQTLLHLFVKWR